jgi:hypothetical protein
MTDSSLPEPQTTSLPEPSTPALGASETLALEALQSQGQASDDDTSDTSYVPPSLVKKKKSNTDDEVEASDELATTLASLQNMIEQYARQLQEVNQEIKEHRETMKNVFDNDGQLAEAEQQAQIITDALKTRKGQLQNDPQVTQLKVKIGEGTEKKKEIEETLSNHLVHYYQLTNSTSFDTSDGDQWEFKIRAQVKPHKMKKDD